MTAMHAYDPVQAVRDALHAAGKRTENARGGGFMAQCPAHEDRNPSLSVGLGNDGQALLWCFAGCPTEDVAAALGMSSAQLFPDYRGMASVTPINTLRAWDPGGGDVKPKTETRMEWVCDYDYVTSDGAPCARVVRYNVVDVETGEVLRKTFRQRRYDNGTYKPGLDGIQVPVYRADLIAKAVAARLPIIVCEGEKDVDTAMQAWNVFATCNPMGAGKWDTHHTESLRGAGQVTIISDNDVPGRDHAEKVRAALEPVVGSVTVKAAAVGKDLADHIAAGYGFADLVDPADAVLGDEAPTSEASWWDERPWLRHIHTFARSRMVSPFALLTVTLVRMAANTLPNLTIPPIVGGRASLNLYGALVGPSGAGKTAVCAATDELLPWADQWVHIGSGEGLLHTYVSRVMAEDPEGGKKRPTLEQHTYTATGIVDEIDTLTALGSRQGATLLPTLRSMWSGGSVGFGYADPTKRLSLPPHSYRLGLIVGAQPTRCEALFSDADAGTPQRFIWAPLIDPDAPDQPPDCPGALLRPPLWRERDRSMGVPQVLRDAVVSARRQALRTGDTKGLDGHALLNRVKVAAAVALMEGRFDINEDDWHLAGRIQATSDNTRAWVQHTLRRERENVAEQRAKGRAREAVVVDETVSDARIGRIARVIGKAVHMQGELLASAAREKVARRDRDDFEPGLHFAVAAGWVTVTERPKSRGDGTVRVLLAGKEKP